MQTTIEIIRTIAIITAILAFVFAKEIRLMLRSILVKTLDAFEREEDKEEDTPSTPSDAKGLPAMIAEVASKRETPTEETPTEETPTEENTDPKPAYVKTEEQLRFEAVSLFSQLFPGVPPLEIFAAINNLISARKEFSDAGEHVEIAEAVVMHPKVHDTLVRLSKKNNVGMHTALSMAVAFREKWEESVRKGHVLPVTTPMGYTTDAFILINRPKVDNEGKIVSFSTEELQEIKEHLQDSPTIKKAGRIGELPN